MTSDALSFCFIRHLFRNIKKNTTKKKTFVFLWIDLPENTCDTANVRLEEQKERKKLSYILYSLNLMLILCTLNSLTASLCEQGAHELKEQTRFPQQIKSCSGLLHEKSTVGLLLVFSASSLLSFSQLVLFISCSFESVQRGTNKNESQYIIWNKP